MIDDLSTVESQLIAAAKEVSTRAYVPASQFPVGCAVLTDNGAIFTGCNVENASFGLTICAERAAIAGAVAVEGPRPSLSIVAVYCSAAGTCSPCGACRQVIAEFGPEATVLFKLDDRYVRRTAQELLPDTFRMPHGR